jgi:hypothetical protein
VPSTGTVIAWPICGCCAARSSDCGITWTAIPLPVNTCWNCLCYCNGCYAATSSCAAATTLVTSNNATTWSNYVLPTSSSWTVLFNECTAGQASYCTWTVVSSSGCYVGAY